jgi:hypothetical protein
MYLMYVDESGDIGMQNSPTHYFVLSGLVVHELQWTHCLKHLLDFRRRMLRAFGLRIREEIHASHLFHKPGVRLRNIRRCDRLAILRHFIDEIAGLPVDVVNVVVDKTTDGKGKDYGVFENAWKALIQRFENTIRHGNFRGPKNPHERGLLFPDDTDQRKLRLILRRMRHYNPIPPQPPHMESRDMPLEYIIEDPCFRNSQDSLFVQAADAVAYVLYQQLEPSTYAQKHRVGNYMARLGPVLCKTASPRDPFGIVRL